MTVERKKDGSVIIKNNGGITSISRTIGVFTTKKNENHKIWVEQCANLVKPCAHTFKETEEYFLQNCDVRPVCPNDRRLKNYLHNVVMNCCKEKLSFEPRDFSPEATDEEIEKWHNEQEAIRNEVMNSTPEHYGLNIRGYYLPRTERNEVYYEQAQNYNQYDQGIIFFFEETTESFQCYSSGGNNLMTQLKVFRGVSEEDIKNRSLRFLSYICTLRDLGELPDIEQNI
jgi:hypothetical protein